MSGLSTYGKVGVKLKKKSFTYMPLVKDTPKMIQTGQN